MMPEVVQLYGTGESSLAKICLAMSQTKGQRHLLKQPGGVCGSAADAMLAHNEQDNSVRLVTCMQQKSAKQQRH